MKRVSIWFVAVACLVIGSASGQEVKEPEKEEQFTLLLHLNALDLNTPEEISLKVGDLILLSAERNQGIGGMAMVGGDQLACTIEGDALEKMKPVQTAIPVRSFPGDVSPPSSTFQFQRMGASQPLLRAMKPGEATLSVTVSHFGNWKETRVFTLTVTEERQPYQRVYGGLQIPNR